MLGQQAYILFYIRRQPRNVPGATTVHPDVIAAAARAEMRRQQLAEQQKMSPAGEKWGKQEDEEDDHNEEEAKRLQRKLEAKSHPRNASQEAGPGPGSEAAALNRKSKKRKGTESSISRPHRDEAAPGGGTASASVAAVSNAVAKSGVEVSSGGLLGLIRRAVSATGLFTSTKALAKAAPAAASSEAKAAEPETKRERLSLG